MKREPSWWPLFAATIAACTEAALPRIAQAPPPMPTAIAAPAPPPITRTAANAEPERTSAEGPRSSALPCGLHNPLPGGTLAGYAADTGLDIAAKPSPVYAIASATIVYAEDGHTRWRGRGDTGYAVLLRLDAPIPISDRRITHAWYAHLTSVDREVAEGSSDKPHVDAGARLGISGKARGAYHLHLGLLLDGDTEQDWGSYLLEDQVRRVLCDLGAHARLASS